MTPPERKKTMPEYDFPSFVFSLVDFPPNRMLYEVEEEISVGQDIQNMDDFERYWNFMKKEREEEKTKREEERINRCFACFGFVMVTTALILATALSMGVRF